jgi:hypothetical protein
MRRVEVDNKEIVELPNFEYNQKGFKELQATLKRGKAVRNPFAQFYDEDVEINILQDAEFTPQVKLVKQL